MRLSRYIREHMREILAAWDEFAKTNAPDDEAMSDLALRDHAEQILLAIAADIESGQSSGEQKRKSEGLSDGAEGAGAHVQHELGALFGRGGMGVVLG